MDDLENRLAEAIKGYQNRRAEAARAAEKEAERKRQKRDKWLEASNCIIEGVRRTDDLFKRERSALRFRHRPEELGEYQQYFEIRAAGSLRGAGITDWYLTFGLGDDDAVWIGTGNSVLGIPGTVALDDLTEDVVEKIAIEVMIAAVYHDGRAPDEV
jgi:hypothetical protein